MQIVRGVPEEDHRGREPVVAVGNFDGVHLGHRAILSGVVRRARDLDTTATALTFDPHPVKVLAPDRPFHQLTSTEEKARLLAGLGLNRMIILSFTRKFARQKPTEFVEAVLHKAVGAREVFVGRNFAFGRDREGTAEDLQRISESFGIRVSIIDPVIINGAAVSSSRIRTLLLEGGVEAAGDLLGRPYEVSGTVVGGEGRGRRIGYPTANLRFPSEMVPGPGVYAVRVRIDPDPKSPRPKSDDALEAIGYIGSRPTFGAGEPMIEIHLFERTGRLYDKNLRIAFLGRIREERTFPDAGELSRQIEADVQRAHKIHETARKTSRSSTG